MHYSWHTGSALCKECVNNFTSLQNIAQDPSSSLNTTLLPRGDERDDEFNVFPFRLWVFPNMKFNCSGNLSRILVRTNASESQTAPPRLAIWNEMENTDNNIRAVYQTIDVPYLAGEVNLSLDMIEYLFNPPLPVMDSQFIGFLFFDDDDQLSLPIAFQDLGANNAPASVHVSSFSNLNDLIEVRPQGNVFTMENFRFFPLIATEFGKPKLLSHAISALVPSIVFSTVEEPVITTPPPMTVPMTTTPSPSTPSTTTDPPLDVEVDVGLYAGIAVAFLLVIVIVLLAVIIAIVVRRKKAQQNIYEVPVEPTPPNLENPMYSEWLTIEGRGGGALH